jgi:hypothetical protein
MALTPDDMQRIRDEETARLAIRKELAGPVVKKQIWIVILLTVCFSCLGLFYVSSKLAWTMIGVSVIMTLATGGALAPVCWLAAIIVGPIAVVKHNAQA